MRIDRWIVGVLLLGSLLTVLSCSLPTQTTFGVGNDGGLTLNVIPNDAELFVDGASMGPVGQYRGRRFVQLKGGKHQIEIKEAGYIPYTQEIFVSGNLTTITVTLKKQ